MQFCDIWYELWKHVKYFCGRFRSLSLFFTSDLQKIYDLFIAMNGDEVAASVAATTAVAVSVIASAANADFVAI